MKYVTILWKVLVLLLFSCSKSATQRTPELVVSTEKISFSAIGDVRTFHVKSNVSWSVTSSAAWLTLSSSGGESGTHKIDAVASTNDGTTEREAVIMVNAGNMTMRVDVIQAAIGHEDGEDLLAVPPISEGVTSDAVALAAKLRVGWNLGNALEAASSPEEASETSWGNPKTTKTLIDAVKAAGFNAIRIPCAWSGYIEDRPTHRLNVSWLARVKEVVDYCVENDMYAIINIHWDGGWLEEHPLYSHQVVVKAKQKALWEQIAAYFRDYDEHLLFAGTNEVRADYSTPTAEHIEVQQSYNQTFVDAVRSTGGRNAYRNLIVQSYNTNIQFAIDYLKMPDDATPNRLMAEVHYYDPWDFAGDEGSSKYLWGSAFAGSSNVSTWGQKSWVDERFARMKAHFVDKGIPVILGEYGAILRSGLADATALQQHKNARNAYLTYVTKIAKANGLIPFYWDNGVVGNNGFGLFNRNNNTVAHPDGVGAIMAGL
ncbi:cellulase family glycosylhydrolase [Sphingobacterium haloxyli]|uniref:DNA mismatch repair protein n=1 Tax=Sphingobacterium haloxyli TaxID=2100533 RepID=A0A2S9IWY8_9SPHI|nr:cellulase family glycosylhydrolase [Sphingobacterium haloxyli]PRD45037.1 DNA mismatch repair protein [Sphingobacterium haloxyli]